MVRLSSQVALLTWPTGIGKPLSMAWSATLSRKRCRLKVARKAGPDDDSRLNINTRLNPDRLPLAAFFRSLISFFSSGLSGGTLVR